MRWHAYHDARDPDGGREVFQSQVARELDENIWNEEDSDDDGVTIASQIELADDVFFWCVIIEYAGVS